MGRNTTMSQSQCLLLLACVLLVATAGAQQSPDKYYATFETCNQGGNLCTAAASKFVVEVTRAWAPQGADRFYELVQDGFFKHTKVFRVVPEFVAQWGISGKPDVALAWQNKDIPDDPAVHDVGNTRGNIVFATSGPNTRTTQVFVNLKDNNFLDTQGFTPFGKVVQGMDVVDKFYSGAGGSPDQSLIQQSGNAYLDQAFPQLTEFINARLSTPQEVTPTPQEVEQF